MKYGTITYKLFCECKKKILKKIKIGLKISVETSDIHSETVTYKDVSRQGRNYKEVDKKEI